MITVIKVENVRLSDILYEAVNLKRSVEKSFTAETNEDTFTLQRNREVEIHVNTVKPDFRLWL